MDAGRRVSLDHVGEEAVVGAHEDPAARAHREGAALGPDARVHHGDEDGAPGEVPVSGVEREGARRHVVGGSSWTRSTSVASGQAVRIAPFMAPT